MSKIEVQQLKTRTRAEIQTEITPGVKEALQGAFGSLEMPRDPDHVRRTCRALAHVVAKIAMESGCPPDGWRYIMDAAWAKEAGAESLGEAVLEVTPLGVGQA